MSKRIETKGTVVGEIEKIRDGIVDYRIVNGKFLPRPLTKCEQMLKNWAVISDNHYSRLTTIKIPVSRVYYPGSFGRRPGWFKIVKSGNCTC